MRDGEVALSSVAIGHKTKIYNSWFDENDWIFQLQVQGNSLQKTSKRLNNLNILELD